MTVLRYLIACLAIVVVLVTVLWLAVHIISERASLRRSLSDRSAAPVRMASPAQPVGGTNDAVTSLPPPVADHNRLDLQDQDRGNPLTGEASDRSNRFGVLRQEVLMVAHRILLWQVTASRAILGAVLV
jgi:hypothetical protein